MNQFKNICLLAWLLLGITGTALAHGDMKFHLELALQTADAKGLAAYVEEDISVEYNNVITTKDKAAVEKIWTDFFEKNTCKAFKIDNQGTYKNGIRHMEGIFETAGKQKFRMYFEAIYDEKEAHHHLSKMVIEKISQN